MLMKDTTVSETIVKISVAFERRRVYNSSASDSASRIRLGTPIRAV